MRLRGRCGCDFSSSPSSLSSFSFFWEPNFNQTIDLHFSNGIQCKTITTFYLSVCVLYVFVFVIWSKIECPYPLVGFVLFLSWYVAYKICIHKSPVKIQSIWHIEHVHCTHAAYKHAIHTHTYIHTTMLMFTI